MQIKNLITTFSFVVADEGITNTQQVVNPDHTCAFDQLQKTRCGTYMLHEVLESYIGGLEYPNAPPADTEHLNELYKYNNAHNKAGSLDGNFSEIKHYYVPAINSTYVYPKYSIDYTGDVPIKNEEYIINHSK